MKLNAILFDLDGTLLPMDQEIFTKGYFQELSKKLGHLGLEPEKLIAAVWAGTKAMVKNDGSRRNADVFWDTFAACSGLDYAPFKEESDVFYVKEFHAARAYTMENPLAAEIVRLAHCCAEHVVCSTNPIFPLSGQLTRLGWIGLKEEDFDLITSYESDCYCKPNPAYFRSVCERINADPASCLLIGNDEEEDMYAATLAGLQCFLVTDHMIQCPEHPWAGKRGTYSDLIEYLRSMADAV